MKTLTEQSPRQLFKSICVFATQELWFKAREVAEELINRGASGVWSNLALDLADGLKKITQISDEIFVLNNEILTPLEKKTIEEASNWVSNKLKQEKPTLIIDVCTKEVPIHAVTGIANLGYISVNRTTLKDIPLLVHEITHCTLMSRSLFLDEGLATLFQDQVSDKQLLEEPEYWDRPSLAALVEIDWSNDPYFLKILPSDEYDSDPLKNDLRVHFLAATVINRFLRKNSLPKLAEIFQKIKPQLREGRSPTVIKDFFSIDLWELDVEIIKNSTFSLDPPTHDSITEIASKILAEDDIESANLWLPTARVKAYEDTDSLIALIKILIVLGNTRNNPSEGATYRVEALVAMNRLESKSNDKEILNLFQAYKFVFKLRNAGHTIELRSIGVQASKAFEELLIKYPENPQVILACAKAQVRTEYDMISQSEWNQKLKTVKSIPLYENSVTMLLEENSRFSI